MSFTVVIPARYASQRLPGKPLLNLGGKSMVERVYEQAKQSRADEVIVATDDDRVFEAVVSFGGDACMTSMSHPSGTDRIHEVAVSRSYAPDQVVVNVQGDEPMIPPSVINQVADNLLNHDAEMATLAEPINDVKDFLDPNVVKVACNERGQALYFSRAPIPWPRDGGQDALPTASPAMKHLGIYAYRVSFLQSFVAWPTCGLEEEEKLEQLRALWNGARIHVDVCTQPIPPGVDTPDDLERVIALLS